MARPSGAERIFKSKCTKHHTCTDQFLKFRFSKNGTPLWREAHLQVKMYKTPKRGTNFWRSDVQKWHTGLAHLQVKSIKTDGLGLLFEFRSGKIARCCGANYILKSKCTKYLCFGTLFGVQMPKNYSVSKVVSQSINQSINQSVGQLVR